MEGEVGCSVGGLDWGRWFELPGQVSVLGWSVLGG